MAQEDKVTSYRTPHESTASAASSDAPREALGRFPVPVVGPVDLELGLGRPIRLDLDAEVLDIEPGSGLIARAPELPTVELRRLRLDLVDGTLGADADALGPFLLRAAGVAAQIGMRRATGWQPGRSVIDHLTQNLPIDPTTGERRVWAGPAGTSAWVHPETRLSVELRGDRAEASLTRAAVLRVLGVALPILAVRLLFGEARLQIDPGPTGPMRRALIRFAAWVATRWLRRRMPAAMKIPGYDLFADEARRARLIEFARRVQGKRRGRAAEQAPGTGSEGQVPKDTTPETGPEEHAAEGDEPSLVEELKATRFTAAQVPIGARALARIPLGERGEIAVATEQDSEVLVVKTPTGLRLEAPGGLFVHADAFPELAELRLARVTVGLDQASGLTIDVQTDPPLGPLLRALSRRLTQTLVLPRVPLAYLREHGLLHERGAEHHVLFRQRFGGKSGVEARTDASAEVRVRHTEQSLAIEAPAGLDVIFDGLPFLPDLTIRKLEYRWSDGGFVADTSPALGEFAELAIAQLIRVRAAGVLPPGLGLKSGGGPELDPQLAAQHSAVAFAYDAPVAGPAEVRLDPGDTVRVHVNPTAAEVTSERALVLLAPELRLALKISRIHHRIPGRALQVESEPAFGDYLSQLCARCLDQFGIARARPFLPLWPDVAPGQPWTLVQAPRSGDAAVQVRVQLPPGAGIVVERGPEALEVRGDAPVQIVPSGTPLLTEIAVERVRYLPAEGRVELGTQPPAGALVHELLRRALARFASPELLQPILARLALPAPAPLPPPAPAPLGAVVWEQSVPTAGAVRVALDPSRTVDVSLSRRGAHIGFGRGATARAAGVGVNLTFKALDLSFLPWTVQLTSEPAAGELEQELLSHALRALFEQFMGYFWPADRSPKAGYDTLLALGEGQPWGPVRVCVASGGSIDVHLDKDGVALRSAAGLFVSGEALDWLPDFFLHELSLRFADAAVKLKISGIQEQVYHEAAPVSPVTEALLSHLLRVLVLPKLPPIVQRLGLRSFPLPPEPTLDASRVVVFGAQLPGEYGELLVSMDAGDAITVRASEVEVLVESERGLQALVPGLRLAVQLRGARYHLQTGEVQVGGLGQLENALIEAVIRRQLQQAGQPIDTPAITDPSTSGIGGIIDKLPTDRSGGRILFKHQLVNVVLPPGAVVRLRLDDAGLRVDVDPPLVVDGLARMNYVVGGLRYSFERAVFSIDIDGDTGMAELFERLVDGQAEKQINQQLLPLLPEAMRTPGYHLTTDPRARDNIAQLIHAFARRGQKKPEPKS